MSIRLMSYNIKHCRNEQTHEIDFDAVSDVIRRSGAEIVGLNEVYDEPAAHRFGRQPQELARRLGFNAFFAQAIVASGCPYGNALLTRFPILDARVIPIPDPEPRAYNGYYESRCILLADLDVPGGLRVCVSHFGLNPDEQENAVRTACDAVRDRRFILMGDMNMTPENPLLNPLRARLFDTAERFPTPLLSFPSGEPECKIDYIFTSPDLSVCSADIPAELVSDHRPHVAEIQA